MVATRAAFLLLGAAFLAGGAGRADELTGTLKRVRDTGTITLGYRQDSIPFSYRGAGGQPIGYSIDLCHEIVDDVTTELDGRKIAVQYKPVTPETRIPALLAGEIDLECGSTTSNLQRKERVAFSPIFFVSGTKLLVRRDSGIGSYLDLQGKTVVVTAGTTNEQAVRALVEKQNVPINVVTAPDHAEGFDRVRRGEADAFATDDVLLYGLMATAPDGKRFMVVGEYLSYDPYGLMYRKDDPAFAAVVDGTFRRLAESRELLWTYDKWFRMRLPSGERLNLPMSPQLQEIFRTLGSPE